LHCVKSITVRIKSPQIFRSAVTARYTARNKMSARLVFSVVKLYRSGHYSFIKASRPCHDAPLREGMDRGEEESGGRDMQLYEFRAKVSAIRSFAAPAQCPHCGDVMVAPVSSEFVEGGEIRHHWECEACGEFSSTSIPLTSH
jgi:hypothetical protein